MNWAVRQADMLASWIWIFLRNYEHLVATLQIYLQLLATF